jgi:hypothetical protein
MGGKKLTSVWGIWILKFYNQKDVEKQNQNYLRVWTEQIENKDISKPWKKFFLHCYLNTHVSVTHIYYEDRKSVV